MSAPASRRRAGLRERHGGERHLGELGQVEQAFRMTVGHAVGGQFLRIITHDGEDGEAELLAGHLVGALPHLAGGRGLGTLVEHHALLLDALARVDEGGLRRTHDGGATDTMLPSMRLVTSSTMPAWATRPTRSMEISTSSSSCTMPYMLYVQPAIS